MITATMAQRTLRLILGDQLSRNMASLRDLNRARDIVVMGELFDEATYVKHHKKKIAFLFSAMRHFAEELRGDGIEVDYTEFSRTGPRSFTDLVKLAIARHNPDRIVVTEPGEWRVLAMFENWREELPCPVEIRSDDRFICDHESFRKWAGQDPKSLRMEYFYREMRRRTGFLMSDGKPEGGSWNFDNENRQSLPAGTELPTRPQFPPDRITASVIDLVEREFPSHFGDLLPFDYPVTRGDALKSLDWFINNALRDFGAYQDAMRQGEAFLFHSNLAALINCGLLDPRECCNRAENAYHAGDAPLNSVEGFIRQIIGWREFVRGIYWFRMPDYAHANALEARRPLPGFFWTGETAMNCLSQSITETKANAYAHHIQRLMVIGNFCLLSGLDPGEVQEWYLLVYQDAYEWVEMPNVVGMILHADGGLLASKPYAASGAYINRMSNYCGNCSYKVSKKNGRDACPFNYLYWDFLLRNRDVFSSNHRMGMMYRQIDRMSKEKISAVRRDAATFLAGLGGDH